jgi:hypothetical protein
MSPESNLLRDALYVLSPKSGASEQYGRGLVVGVVNTLMSEHGWTFEQALRHVCHRCPHETRIACFPEEWRSRAYRSLSNFLKKVVL